MKKILLMMVVFAATMCAFAQDDNIEVDDGNGWAAVFTPVGEAKDLKGVHVAQAGDGSVYVSSKRNVDFEFAGKTVAQPEVTTSSVILKYDKEGTEQWAVTLDGNATVTAMTVDEDGTLYAAGYFSERVDYTGADGEGDKIGVPDETTESGFVLKVSASGVTQKVKVFTPHVNEEIYAITGEDPFTGKTLPVYDMSYNDPMFFEPTSIKVVDGRVYVASVSTGDIDALGWKGSYLNYGGWDASFMDLESRGIISMDTNLKDVKSELYVQTEGIISLMTDARPYSLVFVVKDGKVDAAICGRENLTATTPSGSYDVKFNVIEEDGYITAKEYGIALIQDGEPLILHSTISENDSWTAVYNICGAEFAGDNVILGGTFYGDCPLTKEVEANDFNYVYMASVSLEQGKVNWAVVNPSESETIDFAIAGDKIRLAADKYDAAYDLKTGEQIADDDEDGEYIPIVDLSVWPEKYAATVVVDDNEVNVISTDLTKVATSVESIDASVDDDDVPVFNVLGQPIGPDYKGIAITKSGKKVYVK